MENNNIKIAKRNFLILESNYKKIKKIANCSSKDKNYDALETDYAKSFLTGLGISFPKNYTREDVFTINIRNEVFGYIPNKPFIALLNKIYYSIKHNTPYNYTDKENYYFITAIINYLTSENTNLKTI